MVFLFIVGLRFHKSAKKKKKETMELRFKVWLNLYTIIKLAQLGAIFIYFCVELFPVIVHAGFEVLEICAFLWVFL